MALFLSQTTNNSNMNHLYIFFQGDSGGAMLCMVNYTLVIVGIVSYGMTCGASGMPGVYTEVTHHIDFIAQALGIH